MYIIKQYKPKFERFIEKVEKDNLTTHKELARKI